MTHLASVPMCESGDSWQAVQATIAQCGIDAHWGYQIEAGWWISHWTANEHVVWKHVDTPVTQMCLSAIATDAQQTLDMLATDGARAPWVGSSRWEVLVGEIMSQQTQLDRVIPRWHSWMEQWGTPELCAAAALDDILVHWQGLGYPRRAKALWNTAAYVTEHGWPNDYTELPGVGEYTAMALAAFADRQPVIPLDANVKRVLSRRLPQLSLVDTTITADTGRHLMEFGQRLCRARPLCQSCPLSNRCPVPHDYDPAPRPTRQKAYAGSMRQRRGDVLRAHTSGAALPDDREAIASLQRDGLLPQ